MVENSDYSDYTFPGKSEQMAKVQEFIIGKNVMPSGVHEQEISWFYK